MNDSWLKTQNDEDAEKHTTDFWNRHRVELQAGEFWADRIKELRGEPVKRLKLALDNLPLPASFREAAIATRAIIREKKKAKDNYEEDLALLYWLASINSFSIPYSSVLQEPGYNVIESIPGKKLKNLPFAYNELGYEKLELLNKTDKKWLIDQWGEPRAHTTLHEMHINVWCQYETKLKNRRKRQEKFINDLKGFSTKAQEEISGQNLSIGHERTKNEQMKGATDKENKNKLLLWFVIGAAIVAILIFLKG